uniref:Uncharacterized protein n=1 Tax=Setaria italica TaxID=4555 RepID=K3YMG5_SETIT
RACKKRPCSATSGNFQGINADGGNANSQRATSGNSQGTIADGGTVNSQRVTADQIDAQTSTGRCLDSNDGASGSLLVRDEPPKKARGRGKRNLTQLRLPPSNDKVMLKPVGTRQFTYVNYNPRDYKYGSQVGVIIRRLYLGMVDIRDEEGRHVERRAAMSWHDYYHKKDHAGVTYAKLVKCEFWRVFQVTRADVRKADHNLDAYVVKRVFDLIYQTCLDAVKIHENCDDNQACTIHLIEEEYINSRLEWCAQDAWCFLSKYWASKRYIDKRNVAQASCLKSEDAAPNRGRSWPFGETQQLLEYKFGPDKAGTVNTYAIMKFGFKKVDSTGKSAPIPSQGAQKHLANYSTRTQLPENSKDLDVQALYVMEHGMAHGRVPIGDGCVDKLNPIVLQQALLLIKT